MLTMLINEIQASLAAIKNDAALYEAANLGLRFEAIDEIEFHILDRIAGIVDTQPTPVALSALQHEAQRLKHQLEAIDATLFEELRSGIRTGGCIGTAFAARIDHYLQTSLNTMPEPRKLGYDNLDVFMQRLLDAQVTPIERRTREPEMIGYQPTPARIIRTMVEQAHFTSHDIFYDIGSGLGQVPIMTHLLSGIPTVGIEYEPAYCEYASASASNLNLADVTCINLDARNADYAQGTVFFLYTPFVGSILQEVLELLHRESYDRHIRVFSYGPCTLHVAHQGWLRSIDQAEPHSSRLTLFSSR